MVGVALGIWLYLYAVDSQLNDVSSSLADDCDERRVAVQSSIDALRLASLALAAVVGSHPVYGINYDIFSNFVAQSSLVSIRTALERATWIQRVYDNERDEWEAKISAEFGGNFTIVGDLMPASSTRCSIMIDG
jgi:hypothetical protein